MIEYVFNGFYSQKGEHSLSFNFNTNKELDEISYSNNNSRIKVSVVPAYDIYITGIELSPENPIPDQSVIILVNVKNNGVRDMTSEFGLQSPLIEFEDFNLSVIDIPSPSSVNPLKVGGTDQYRIEGKFSSSGSKNLKMTLNVNGDLDESKKLLGSGLVFCIEY